MLFPVKGTEDAVSCAFLGCFLVRICAIALVCLCACALLMRDIDVLGRTGLLHNLRFVPALLHVLVVVLAVLYAVSLSANVGMADGDPVLQALARVLACVCLMHTCTTPALVPTSRTLKGYENKAQDAHSAPTPFSRNRTAGSCPAPALSETSLLELRAGSWHRCGPLPRRR
jgi:hypothetical protein